jgi:cell division protein FtsQ
MKSHTDQPAGPPGRSWRSIRQDVSAPAKSGRGLRRQVLGWLRVGTITVGLASLGWGLYELAHSWRSDRAALASAVHSAPVREIALITDGVLTKTWVAGVLALPRGASLMALDLAALRDKLLAHGQVRVAVLTRNFPDTLVVTLQERSPVARVQAADGTGLPRQLLVAKDGIAYEGIGYDKPLVASLPWLDGVRLVKSGNGYAPIPGMSDVSALLSTAQLQAPHLYRGWLIVSLARLEEADEIVVKAQDVPRIVFSRKRDYYKQIAQLDYVVDAAHGLPVPELQSVNLTLDGQVPVRLSGTPDEMARAARPEFSLQPSPPRNKQRDL